MDNHLVFHLGSRSELTLLTPERTLRCYPGDLHALTAADVTLVADLLRAGALSTTGQIRKKGHDLTDKLVTVQHLPALQLEDRLLTSTDIRAFQIAKATAAAAQAFPAHRAFQPVSRKRAAAKNRTIKRKKTLEKRAGRRFPASSRRPFP